MDIKNKVAIITGGIRGIGFVTVQFLLRHEIGYVAIFDIHKPNSSTVSEALKKLENEFSKEKFGYYECDVTKEEKFTENYDKVMESKKYVDILVNNAGVANDNDVDLTIDLNFKAVVKCTLAAIRRMGKQNGNKNGVVVNIASFLGLINAPVCPVYNATKHAVVSFVRSMTDHNKTLGVRIVCVCPGMTKTLMTEKDSLRKSMFDFIDESVLEKNLNTYFQEPDNVALAVVEIIKKGYEGDVWVAKCDEPPFAVGEETDLEKMRVPF